jgi:hypothetical protein
LKNFVRLFICRLLTFVCLRWANPHIRCSASCLDIIYD